MLYALGSLLYAVLSKGHGALAFVVFPQAAIRGNSKRASPPAIGWEFDVAICGFKLRQSQIVSAFLDGREVWS